METENSPSSSTENKCLARFLNKNGYKSQREEAAKVLEEGKWYEVALVVLGTSSSKVYLTGIKESPFNTVMFEFNFDPYDDEADTNAPITNPYKPINLLRE